MDIQRLREVQSRERSTDSLQDLPESFYSDVAAYVEELKAERERAAARADDPFDDPEVNRLTDQIDTAEQVAESLYERRVGKLVKQASFAAADMGGNETGLTAEERDLYRDLVERIGENKNRVLDVLAGEAGTDEDGDADAGAERATGPTGAGESPGSPPPERDPVDAASLMGDGSAAASEPGDGTDADTTPQAGEAGPGASARADADGAIRGSDSTADAEEPASDGDAARPAAPAAGAGAEAEAGAGAGTGDRAATGPGGGSGSDRSDRPPEADAPRSDGDGTGADRRSDTDAERTTIQVTRDVGEILGVDERVYDLESDDVVTLPAENATPLLEKGAADRLD